MSLRRVDKLVREEKYEQALKVLLEVRSSQPNNPYLPAYEERLRSAIEVRSRSLDEAERDPESGLGSPEGLNAEFPSVEEQLRAIARSIPRAAEPKVDKRAIEQRKREEQRRVALLSKIASLIGSANEFLEKGEFDRALEEVARATMLDPRNGDIADLEGRIRSSQEDALRVAEEQRRLVLQQEEAEREQRLQREREEALRESEARREREEKARRAAQEQKVILCLRRSREFLNAGLLDEAQTELAFALVLQPHNTEASTLEGELTRRYEDRRQAELARERAEEEERRREEERIRAAVTAAVREAEEASRRGDFARALARITEAYIDDPGNPTLAACESEILAARDAWARKQKEEALAAEEARRKAREEEERQREDQERQRVREEREAQARAQQKEEEEQLWYHLRRARTLLSSGKHDQALAEVALAFVVNPFREEVKELEAEILLAQGAASIHREGSGTSEPDQPEPPDEAAREEVRSVLERATIHGTRKEFARAFEEIARAYAISSMDPTIAECEARIQAAFVKYQEELAPVPSKSPPPGPRAEDAPARRRRAKFHRRGRSVERAGTAPAPLMRSAAPRSGRGSRAVRMLMTAVTLGAISVSGVYLVDPESTRTPRSPAGPADKDPALQQGTVPTPREFDANSPRDQSRAPGREIGALSRRPEVVRQTARLEFNEAGFSSLPELTEADIRSSDKASVAEDTTSLTAEGPELLSLDPAEDSASTVVTDSLTEDAGDLYATTALPGATLTQAPQIMRLSRPQLTDISRRSETEEEITVMVEIGADGVPLQARVVQSTYPPYNHAVIDAVMRSDFQAGLTPSGPAAKWMTIPFRIKP